jgi:hypothetical protein
VFIVETENFDFITDFVRLSGHYRDRNGGTEEIGIDSEDNDETEIEHAAWKISISDRDTQVADRHGDSSSGSDDHGHWIHSDNNTNPGVR